MHGVGRGERARVAERVRAVLAEALPEDAFGDVFGAGLVSDDDADDGARGDAAGPPPEHTRGPSLGERLAARRPVRLDPGRRGALAVGIAALVTAVLTGWWVWSARPHSVPVYRPGPAVLSSASTPGPAGSPAAATPSPATSGAPVGPAIVVDVVGKVRRPGLYKLPSGARVADAIDAAGGTRPGVDTAQLNLAARVSDGQQVAVGVAGAGAGGAGGAGGADAGAPSGPGGDTGSTAPAGAPVSLNTATLEQLETLPGVGPVLGQHILDWRDAHGSFTSVGQLDDVPGIGPAKFGELKNVVTL